MKILKPVFKIFLAGIIAFIILEVFSYFYYNIPDRIKAPGTASDYAWKPEAFFSRGTEGYALGRIDSNGYNNISIPQTIDVLIMGSSHMEAFNVMQNENTAYKLNDLLSDNGLNMNAYNIGISSHSVERCLNNLENAVDEFAPSKYVVIESVKTQLNINSLKKILADEFERINYDDSGIINQLSKSKYLRLMYKQYMGYIEDEKSNSSGKKVDESEYEEVLNKVLGQAAETVGDDRKLIIVLSQNLSVDEYGNVDPRKKDFYYNTLKKACENNNIIFVDMIDSYFKLYKDNHILPHGFSNSKVGEGHLNKYGHSVMASQLYKVIKENEVK